VGEHERNLQDFLQKDKIVTYASQFDIIGVTPMQELLQEMDSSLKGASAGQRRLLMLFIEDPLFFAFHSAGEIGKKASVSESTVIRWTQKLGYKGFLAFQQVVQVKMAEEKIQQQQSAAPQKESFLSSLFDEDAETINRLKKTLSEDQFLKAIDQISQADTIYVTSDFYDYGLAHLFSHWLNILLSRTVLLVEGDMNYYVQLSKIGKQDVVIALTFPRYTKTIIETIMTSKEQEASVIVITDTNESPASLLADVLLTVPINTNLNIDSYTAVLSLLTSIMRFVSVREIETVSENVKRIEKMYEKKNIFLTKERT
jgi:DNA-binding MurR/RpiR family transcriptional regulator